MESHRLRAYLVDDEPLAIARLTRMIANFASIQVVGSATEPGSALSELMGKNPVPMDLLFLDIQMPGMNGFEMLARLDPQPFVIFTTAYDEYALRAFEVNSIDYLVKPVEMEQLTRAITKLERLFPTTKPEWQQSAELPKILHDLAASLNAARVGYPRRIASRVGERISFLDLDAVTHFIAQDKLTYAVVDGHRHSVDQTIVELERRLDPARFLRVHRSALVNVDWIQEVHSWFAGKVLVSLKDQAHTQIPVARDRVRALKSQMGL